MTFRRCDSKTADFGIEHADELRAVGHVEAQQLFGRKAERMLLVHRGDVVETIEIADRLHVRLVLDQLLGAAMKQADVRIDAFHDLAVEFEHEAQHAVRRGVLRPEVDVEVADLGLGHFQTVPRRNRCKPGELRLVVHSLLELFPVDDHTLMLALADQINPIMGFDMKE